VTWVTSKQAQHTWRAVPHGVPCAFVRHIPEYGNAEVLLGRLSSIKHAGFASDLTGAHWISSAVRFLESIR